MKNLIRALKLKEETHLESLLDRELDWLEKYTCNRKEPYKKNRKDKIIRRVKAIQANKLEAQLQELKELESVEDSMPNTLTIIVNFYKSSTWGYCPKGSDNYGNVTDSITGCGYCKESTATAQILNQNKWIMKRLAQFKDDPNNAKLEYGAGYAVVPRFEGGVGVSSHQRILEQLGYKVNVTGNSATTVMTVSES